MEHVALHPETLGHLLCGTCWLPHGGGHRCHVALMRHNRGWRLDHTPNLRDWYPDVAGFERVLAAWLDVSRKLEQEAEELAAWRPGRESDPRQSA
jgi:hypothetical protein